MDTFKDRLAFLWKDEARQAKIAADIDMTIAGFSRIWNEGGLPKSEQWWGHGLPGNAKKNQTT